MRKPSDRMPKPIIYAALVIAILAMIPPALIARARVTNSDKPRIHLFQDMGSQHRFNTQQVNPMYADGRAMRPPVAKTVARGELRQDDHYYRGVIGDEWATEFPAEITVDRAFIERGQERFNIYCSVCHGLAGYGDGMVHQRANQLLSAAASLSKGTVWVPPLNLHEPQVREQPVGQIYNTITNGVRNMAGYGAQIPVEDRWAIVAYVEALQRSQNAQPSDIPADQRENLPVVELPDNNDEES